MKRILIPSLLLVLLAGCTGKPAATPAPTAEPTVSPVASFEKFVADHPIKFSASSITTSYCGNLEIVGTSYDVKTTDSLVSPYVGTIVYTYHNHNGNYPGDETVTLTYAFQGGAWVLKDTKTSEPGMLPTTIGGQKFPGMCEIFN